MQFKGRLKLPGDQGPGIAIELRVDDIYLILSSGGELLGRWRVDDVGIQRDFSNQFILDLDGETMLFVANDALGFAYEGMTAIEELSARLSKRKRRRRDRSRLGGIFSRGLPETSDPADGAPEQPAPEPGGEPWSRRHPEPVEQPIEEERTRPAAMWMRPDPPAEPVTPSRPPEPDGDVSHPQFEVEAFKVDDIAASAPASEVGPPRHPEPEEVPVYSDDAGSWAVDVESIDLAGLYGEEKARPTEDVTDEAPAITEQPSAEEPPAEETGVEVTVEPERPRRRSRHARAEDPVVPEPEPPVPEPQPVEAVAQVEPEVVQPDAEPSVTEPEPEQEEVAAEVAVPEPEPPRPEPAPPRDVEVDVDRNGHERKSGFFRRRVKEVDHEHEYRESKTVGGITRRVCSICGHVSFAGEDVYQGWS